MIVVEHTAPPLPLSLQLGYVLRAEGISLIDAGRLAGLTDNEIFKVFKGNATIRVFLRLLAALGYGLAVTTWDGRLLLPLHDSIDADKLCKALTEYERRFSDYFHFFSRSTPHELRMLEMQQPNATVDALQQYLDHTHTRASIVRAFE